MTDMISFLSNYREESPACLATYYQLFVREYSKAPWLFCLQDHGWGGNYDRFGKDGILEAITYNLTSAHMKLHKHTQYAYSFPTIW